MIEVIEKLAEISVLKYIKSDENGERGAVSDLAFENNDEYAFDLFGEILLLEEDIFLRYLKSVEIGYYSISAIKSLIYYLDKKCIFNKKEIVEWINKYSEKFPKYFDYMLAVENLREAFVYYLKNIVLPDLINKKSITNLQPILKLNSNICSKYLELIPSLDISNVEVTKYYKYYYNGESVISTKLPGGASYYSCPDLDNKQAYVKSNIILTFEKITENFILEEYIVKACLAIKADSSSSNKTLEDEILLVKDIKSLCNNNIFPVNVEELKKEFFMLFDGSGDIEEIRNIYFSKIEEFAYIGEPVYYNKIYSYGVSFFFIANNKFYFVNYVSRYDL